MRCMKEGDQSSYKKRMSRAWQTHKQSPAKSRHSIAQVAHLRQFYVSQALWEGSISPEKHHFGRGKHGAVPVVQQ